MHPRAAAANQFCEGRLPVRVTVRSRVSWRLRVPPTAAPFPAPTNVTSRRRPPPPRYDGRGDDVCRSGCPYRPPLLHPPRPPTSRRAAKHHRRGTTDEATPCVVADARSAHRCPTPRAHQHPIAPPAITVAHATDVAKPFAGVLYAKDTGFYSHAPKPSASVLQVSHHDDAGVARTSTCDLVCPPKALCDNT